MGHAFQRNFIMTMILNQQKITIVYIRVVHGSDGPAGRVGSRF